MSDREFTLTESAAQEAADLGARLIRPDDPEWPTSINVMQDRTPSALWVRGPLELTVACKVSCTVTGSRAATDYGKYVATEIGADLAAYGVTVVTGAALGVEVAALQGAMTASTPQIVILPSGIDYVFSGGTMRLLERITETGLVVAMVPPGTPPSRVGFLEQSRLAVALALGNVVVEALAGSKAHDVAEITRSYGRKLMAVPGPVTSSHSVGTHHLIRRGATLVTNATDVADELGIDIPHRIPRH